MATLGIYYFDGTSFSFATAVYTDVALTTLAADGFYSNESTVRQQLNGVLLNAQPCGSCAVDCGSGVSANVSANGWFDATVNLANSTGATVIYCYLTSSVPDGIIVNYNSVNYNRLTSKYNHSSVTLVDAAGTQVDYAGINNQNTGLPTYVGNQNAGLIGSYTTVPEYLFSAASNTYVSQGTSRDFSVVNNQVGFATDSSTPTSSPVFTMVVPKTLAAVTTVNIQFFAPMSGTVFNWQIACPAALPSFSGSTLQSNITCASNTATYYFVRNAVGTSIPYTVDTNIIPEIGNFVFTDVNGGTYLNDTNTLQYIIVNNSTALGIRNGVVISSAACTGGGGGGLISYSTSVLYPNLVAVICNQFGTPAADQLYFHNGTGTYPIAGDVVYSNSAGTVTLNDGFYYLYTTGFQRTFIQVNGGNGVVASQGNCVPT